MDDEELQSNALPPLPSSQPQTDGESAAESTEGGKKRRRRRDPFAGMSPVYSSDAALRSRDLSNRSSLRQIRKSNVRHEGHKVYTDDVKKLKSLAEAAAIPEGDLRNFYAEPVRIEYYIPKESRFAVEMRTLYIPLIDPEPEEHHEILIDHIEREQPVDLMAVMDSSPQHISSILESYNNTLSIYESLSKALREAAAGSDEQYRTAFYLIEILTEYEPTLAALELIGQFHAWNLNWLIRKLNTRRLEFYASDKTVSYLIKLRNDYWEEQQLPYDDHFEVLAALFFEQAFPNRGMTLSEDDLFLDIFDRKRQY